MSVTVSGVGRLADDAKFNPVTDTGGFISFDIATDRWSRKDGKVTDWFRCSMWSKPGAGVMTYLTKGKEVFVTGRMEIDSTKDKDGNPRKYYTIRLDSFDGIRLVGGKGNGSSSQAADSSTADDDRAPF